MPRQIYHKPVRELLRDMPTLPSDEFPFLSAQAPFSRPLPRGVKHGQDVYLFAANAVNSEIVALQNQFPRSINPAGLAWKVRGQHAHRIDARRLQPQGVVQVVVGAGLDAAGAGVDVFADLKGWREEEERDEGV